MTYLFCIIFFLLLCFIILILDIILQGAGFCNHFPGRAYLFWEREVPYWFKRSTSFLEFFSDAGSRWLHSWKNYLESNLWIKIHNSPEPERHISIGLSIKISTSVCFGNFCGPNHRGISQNSGFSGNPKNPHRPGFTNPRFRCTGTAPDLAAPFRIPFRNPPGWRSPKTGVFAKNPKNPVFGGQTGYLNNR